MKKIFTLSAALCMLALPVSADEQIVLLNEGYEGGDGSLLYFENSTKVSEDWFYEVNNAKLGNMLESDIVRADDNTLAIAIQYQSVIQFIDLNCKAVGSIEGVPNCRKMVSDGSYLYVTSTSRRCTVAGATVNFTKGFVAKVDLATKQVVSAVEVGENPDGIVIYGGRLFVTKLSGPSYDNIFTPDKTINVVNAETMSVERNIDVQTYILPGQVSRSGRYMLVGWSGIEGRSLPGCLVLDCQAVLDNQPDAECFQTLSCNATYNTVETDGNFLCVGSKLRSDDTYTYDYVTIDPALVMSSKGEQGVEHTVRGAGKTSFEMGMLPPYMLPPYLISDIYVNPASGYLYIADLGRLTCVLDPGFEQVETLKTKAGTCHILSLAQGIGGVDDIMPDVDAQPVGYYNLQGMYSKTPWSGLNIVRMSDGSTRKVAY